MGSPHEEFENGMLPESSVTINGVGTGRSSLIFLGTGCSSAVPNARCLIRPTDPPCAVCFQSLSLPPERNPNYRYTLPRLLILCILLRWIWIRDLGLLYEARMLDFSFTLSRTISCYINIGTREMMGVVVSVETKLQRE